MNPNKRDEGSYSYFLDDQENNQFGDKEINNCLT